MAIKTVDKDEYVNSPKLSKALADEISILQTLDCDETVRLRHRFDSPEHI